MLLNFYRKVSRHLALKPAKILEGWHTTKRSSKPCGSERIFHNESTTFRVHRLTVKP